MIGQNITAEAILFEDHFKTELKIEGAVFRLRSAEDETGDDASDFLLVHNGHIVASGGPMLNYKFPYADIYMSVKEPFRQKAMGASLFRS